MARPKEQPELRSNLAVYIPGIIAGEWASVVCPHCDGVFQIEGKRWRKPLWSAIKPGIEVVGRSCPYCMKVSLIPLDFFGKKDRARLAHHYG